jgi:carboxyl-terminal processing protease
VEDVFPGSPAASAGIQRFDRILQVGDTSLRNATTGEASLTIRGPEGSTAVLTIQRAGQMLTIPVVRSAIRAPRVEARFVQPGVAYARVFEFSRGSGRALGAALGELAAQAPLRSIVLDLRGNPGGLIMEAGRIGSLFLPTGTPLARVHDRDNGPSVLRAAGPAPFADVPLAILVDGGSASASEIIAGAFRDAHRGTIVGEKTAGALGGAVDIALPEGGMSVTVERITTPLGEQVEGTGIVPDHPVALTVADMERGQDVQLDAALRTLGAVETFHL